MDPDWSDAELLQHVFDETTVLRKPLRGIIAGYHVLPYILVGADHGAPSKSVEVRGRIKVSPRLVIGPGRDGPTYGELFGETELMDQRIEAGPEGGAVNPGAPQGLLFDEAVEVARNLQPLAFHTISHVSGSLVLVTGTHSYQVDAGAGALPPGRAGQKPATSAAALT